MNGIVDETGKVAVAITDSLRTQPLVLALIVMNVLWFGGGAWIMSTIAGHARTNNERTDKLVTTLLQTCGPAHKE